MTFYIVLKNGKHEKHNDNPELNSIIVSNSKETGESLTDPALLEALRLVSEQILSVYADEDLAKMCAFGLSQEYPKDKFSVAQLHMITSTAEWS